MCCATSKLGSGFVASLKFILHQSNCITYVIQNICTIWIEITGNFCQRRLLRDVGRTRMQCTPSLASAPGRRACLFPLFQPMARGPLFALKNGGCFSPVQPERQRGSSSHPSRKETWFWAIYSFSFLLHTYRLGCGVGKVFQTSGCWPYCSRLPQTLSASEALGCNLIFMSWALEIYV